MKLMDKIRDILYDSVDYIFMIVILLIVVGVIGWRLDVLFAKDALGAPTPGQVIVDNTGREGEGAPETDENPENPDGRGTPSEGDDPAEQPSDPSSPVIVMVEIPVGSMPGKIGLLLEEKGIVSSSREFIAKAVELDLDTKLKSGTYKIQLGLPTEDVVRLLTN
ncbi:MAG: hypothetical protein ACQEP4_05895 [Bacillota bacterium]